MLKASWTSYLKSLFFSTPGYFRIIVFTVTNKPFTSSGKKINKETAIGWLYKGLNVLPQDIGNKKFGKDYNCTALVYEYKKPESVDAFLVIPGLITAYDHLVKSRIITKLQSK